MPLLPKGNMFTGKTLKEYLLSHMPENEYQFHKMIRFILDKSPLPVYLKGIMTPEDADITIKM